MAMTRKNVRVCQVKYLTAYYDVILAVDDLDEVNDILQEWALWKWGVVLDLPEALIYNKDITEVLTSVTTDNFAYVKSAISAYMEIPRYAGISGTLPTFPAAEVGGVYVMPECTAFLYSAASFGGFFGEYEIDESSLTLSAGLNYIGIKYNAGEPEWVNYTSDSYFDYSSIIPAIIVLKIGTALYVIPYGQMGYGLPEKLIQTQKNRKNFEIISEFTLGHTTMYVNLSALTVNTGTADVDCLIMDTEEAANTMIQYYLDGSSEWQTSTITQLNSTQYQTDGSGLALLAGGEYVVNYVFRAVDGTNKLLFMALSNKFATLAAAKESEMLTELPDVITKTAVCVGRFILEKDSTAPVIQKSQRIIWGTVA